VTTHSFRAARAALIALVLLSVYPSAAHSVTVPNGFTDTLIAGGLSAPTAMAFAPDGRIFVCEQAGRLRVVKNGVLLSTPFLTLTVDSSGERGLLGVTFDPDFQTNRYVYVYYTVRTSPRRNRVSRFTANGDVVVPGSEQVLLTLNNLSSATNHNGGALHFGPDGYLYIAVGDNANGANAQNPSNLLGKILRIAKDGTIPASNPFYTAASGNNRAIWALGLRNPYTFAFHPTSNAMFINDVGQSAWEEIDDGIAGANYGWPQTEGPTTDPRYRSPRYAYRHSSGLLTGCAITGGTFYAPSVTAFPPEYNGRYFFADYCSGWIAWLDPSAGNSVQMFATGGDAIVDLRADRSGMLYYLARGDGGAGAGGLYAIGYDSTPPGIVTQPANATVIAGATATFTVSASGTSPLSYQWQKNAVAIPGATAASYTTPPAQAGDSGASFRVVVRNPLGTITSNPAILTVGGNSPPTATITLPAIGALYTAGTTINVAGTGTDTEDGTLPASVFSWRVDFHHDTHLHPFLNGNGSRTATFVVPTTGHTESNVWYRIHLEVRDSAGQPSSTFRDLLPRKSTFTLATVPANLSLTLDAQPVTVPTSVEGVVGVERSIGAPLTQTVGGSTYEFVSWSDGGAATHAISTPAAGTTYTATYRLVTPSCTIASPPVNLTASVSGATLTLRWTAPPAGPRPASYRVEYGIGPGQTQMSASVAGSTTTASGILPGSGTFYFRVKSVNTCGTSTASNEAMVQR
jgi:glucose/arabinose dehydrogenase